MDENRDFIRHPSDIPIEFSTGPDAAPEWGQVQNVSLGGLAFDTESCPERGSIVQVRIPFVRPPFTARCRVVWCRSMDGRYEIGVQFLDASDAFRARMVEQVCHIEDYRKTIQEREGRELSGDAAAREWISKFAASFPDPRERKG